MTAPVGVIICDKPWKLTEADVHKLVSRFQDALVPNEPTSTRFSVLLDRTKVDRKKMAAKRGVSIEFSSLLEIHLRTVDPKIKAFRNPKAAEIWLGIGTMIFCSTFTVYCNTALPLLEKKEATNLLKRIQIADELDAVWIYPKENIAHTKNLGPI